MDVNSLSGVGSLAGFMDKQLFGAQVVSKTLDYMHAGTGMGSGDGGMSQTYDFAKNVLGGYMAGKGAISDMKV